MSIEKGLHFSLMSKFFSLAYMEASRLKRDEKQEQVGKHYATENELIEGFYTIATAI